MENSNLPPHWQVLASQDPELNEKVQAWKSHIEESDSLERKYKELLMVSMSCVARFNSGLRAHSKKALQYGATKAELFAAIEQSLPAFWRLGQTALSSPMSVQRRLQSRR